MTLSFFQKLTLGASGVIALAIGAFILFAPHAFYASYGIAIANDPNLLSELRAPGAALAAMGGIMLVGLVRETITTVSIALAFTVYLAFPAGRAISLIADGVPSSSILGALAIEVVMAALLLVAFARPSMQIRDDGPNGLAR